MAARRVHGGPGMANAGQPGCAAVPPIDPDTITGKPAPEIQAAEWMNVEGAPTLADLRGNVVLVEFWATCCRPCRSSIPHLAEVYQRLEPEGQKVLSFTRENRQTVQNFMHSLPIPYPIGLGSRSDMTYGVRGIPHAFVIGKDGNVVWHGHPMDAKMETVLEEQMR